MRHEDDDHGLVVASTNIDNEYDDDEREQREHAQRALRQQEDGKKNQDKKRKDQDKKKKLEPSLKWKTLGVNEQKEYVS